MPAPSRDTIGLIWVITFFILLLVAPTVLAGWLIANIVIYFLVEFLPFRLRTRQPPSKNETTTNYKAIARSMAERMASTISKYLNKPVEILSIEDTGEAAVVDLVIGDALISVQDRVVVPYEYVKNLEYWQRKAQAVIAKRQVQA